MAARVYIVLVAALVVAAVYFAGTRGNYSVESLGNVVLYGILALLSVVALQRERFFRGIFYQLCFLFTGFSLVIALRIFADVFPNNLRSDIYVYSTMLLPLFMCWTVVYVLYAYIFHDWTRSRRMLLTLATVLPFWLIAFHPYYFAPRALPAAADVFLYYHPLWSRAVYVNLMSLSAIGVFFLMKLRSDKTIGVYIDTLMFWFCLFIIFEILYDFSRVTTYSVFEMSQYAATGTLLMLTGTFVLRLRFLSQTAGILYESQIVSPDPFVGRRAGFFDRFIRGNFFDSEAIEKRLYLEKPKGRIRPKFLTGGPTGTGVFYRTSQAGSEERET